MNLLAHLYLSGENQKIMVGNFLGDFVKGKNLTEQFEPEIVLGIALHRAIDEFTDSHPVVLKSKIRLRPRYRHYAPVIVDVLYDHFLAKYWSVYHDSPLSVYAARAYSILKNVEPILPEEVKKLLVHMISANWLVNYSHVAGIERTLAGMSRRSKFNPKMNEAVNDFQAHYEDFKKEFEEFFPELKTYSQTFLKTAEKQQLK